jgi:hypothetical protein
VLDFEEVFAGEAQSLRPPPRVRAWVPRVLASFRTGLVAGIVPAFVAGAIYFALHNDADLPWVKIAALLAVYGPSVGVLLAVFVDGAVALFDRVARVGYGVGLVANAVTAGALGGFFAGIAPGAIGVAVFGAYHGPFVGTPAIVASLISGAILIAIPLARRARVRRRGAGSRDRAAIAVATLVATLILCVLAAVVAPIIVDSAFAEAQTPAWTQGSGNLVVGAVAGALGGCVVGIYIGLAIALGRTLRV